MSDLVERLREVAERPDANYPAIMEQAAARIEQLEAALRSVSVEFDDTYSPASREGRLGRLARAALEDKCTSS